MVRMTFGSNTYFLPESEWRDVQQRLSAAGDTSVAVTATDGAGKRVELLWTPGVAVGFYPDDSF